MAETLHFTDRRDWRAWLDENHGSVKEVWLIFYKSHTGKSRIPYDDAVEEALCFGWIDSIVKRIDDEKYAQKFTPRKSTSKWSELNKERVRKMIKEGKMTEAGLAKIREAKRTGKWTEIVDAKKQFELTPEIKRALAANKQAFAAFSQLAPSYQRQYIAWIMSAKREETRKRRLEEAITLLAQNKRLGLK